jgi:CHU_C Type IX secretion signal domain
MGIFNKRKPMKNICLGLLLFTTFCYSQQDNIWYFGHYAGIDFNNGAPVALTNGQLDTIEGCATMSDETGNLLFYTDGVTVWGRDHIPMQNGTGLWGHESTTQSAIIIPMPGSNKKYYVFTADYQGHNHGLRYSIIDLELNSGLGGVTDKNIFVKQIICEKLTAIKKPNGIDYWVVVHGLGNAKFFAYSVTDLGISEPVISEIGTFIVISGINAGTAGVLKFSPDGTKIASANSQKDVQLFDFDMTTGILSNVKTLCMYPFQYGIEFSPSGRFIYISIKPDTSKDDLFSVIQMDLNASDISSTETLIYTFKNPIGSLQLGPDGKIYVPYFNGYNEDTSYLAAIHDPDIAGVGCHLDPQAVSLGHDRWPMTGLPQCFNLPFNASIIYLGNCLGEATHFALNTNKNVETVSWEFGDGQIFSGLSAQYTFENTGSNSITATITFVSGISIVKNIDVWISENAVANPIPDQQICSKFPIIYDLTLNNASVLAGQNSENFSIAYYATFENAHSGSNELENSFEVMGDTVLFARVTNLENSKCYDVTSFNLSACKSIPRGISPGDSSKNNTFDLSAFDAQDLSIYNRYGMQVYSKINYKDEWYGQDNNGNSLPDGTYYYYIQMPDTVKTGWVYVNRAH